MMNLEYNLKRNNTYTTVSQEQKNAEVNAINSLILPHGLTVTRIVESPRMIQYRVQLAPETNVKKIIKMQENFSIALADNSVNVFRDKAELVIEKRGADNTIYLGDMVNDYFRSSTRLAVALGKDAEGHNIYTDIARMPHCLIAGATGSGKSVCLDSIITSLVVKDGNDIEIFAVDTKRTELTRYAGIPDVHVITEAEDAIQMLANMCNVMENRYKSLEKYGCRNIDELRAAGYKAVDIVIVIDEFADLMLLSGKTVEQYVVRLAQKARAAGIHLIIATQRPTRDVITGLIKANIPTRICLKTTSGLESRIVLDRNGAENLTGNGDMLFLANGAFEPIRLQGAFVSTQEIIAIRNTIVANKTPQRATEPPKNERRLPPMRSYEAKSFFKKLFNR